MARKKIANNEILKDILREYYFKGYSYRELSKIFGLSLTTCYRRINEV